MARSRKRNELRFLISARVPSGAPGRRTETLASQRNDPSCMLPSQILFQTTMSWTFLAYATASCAERISGSETISSSGVPARLRSIALSFVKSRYSFTKGFQQLQTSYGIPSYCTYSFPVKGFSRVLL